MAITLTLPFKLNERLSSVAAVSALEEIGVSARSLTSRDLRISYIVLQMRKACLKSIKPEEVSLSSREVCLYQKELTDERVIEFLFALALANQIFLIARELPSADKRTSYERIVALAASGGGAGRSSSPSKIEPCVSFKIENLDVATARAESELSGKRVELADSPLKIRQHWIAIQLEINKYTHWVHYKKKETAVSDPFESREREAFVLRAKEKAERIGTSLSEDEINVFFMLLMDARGQLAFESLYHIDDELTS